jgi:aminoglycoside 2'-N-acetyltransferase I
MTHLEAFTTADAPPERLRRIRALLDDAFGGDFSDHDWDHALGGWHVTVTSADGELLAHASVVSRLLEIGVRSLDAGYVEAVATAPSVQGQRHGSHAMASLNEVIRREFEVGALSTDRHTFYERLGWEGWWGPTFVLRGEERVRTEDEDDGVMVLRFGPSADVALTDPITCRARPGDDW